MQELLALNEIEEFVNENTWHTIIVDCGPSADLLRTLSAPEMLLGYLERVWPRHERVAAIGRTDPRMAVAAATVERIVAGVEAVKALLGDWDRTSACLITAPERVALAEAARSRSAAALLGLRLAAVVVNKVLPQVGTDDAPRETESRGVLVSRSSGRTTPGDRLSWSNGWRVCRSSWSTHRAGTGRARSARRTGRRRNAAAVRRADRSQRTGLHRSDWNRAPVSIRCICCGCICRSSIRRHCDWVELEDDLIVGVDGVRRRVRLASGIATMHRARAPNSRPGSARAVPSGSGGVAE